MKMKGPHNLAVGPNVR